MKVNEVEYFYIRCNKCDDQVKIAKNKGAYWKTYENFATWINEFLWTHSDCEDFEITIHSE